MNLQLTISISMLFVALCLSQVAAQAPNSEWVYPSPTGNLLYQLDSRGQHINDFSQCGYRSGTEPLPNATALIPQSRWVSISPGTGDDTALIQAAIDSVEAMTPDANGWRGVVYLNAGEYQLATTITIQASGVVLKGAGDSSTTGTRLRATDARQYTLVSATNSTSRSTVSGSTHNLTQKLVPAVIRTFEVDSTSGLAVGLCALGARRWLDRTRATVFLLRGKAFPTRKKAFPTRKKAFPTRKKAFPTRKKAFPTRKKAFPTGKKGYRTGAKGLPTWTKARLMGGKAYPLDCPP
jgi:hypothetical protein